MEPDVIRIYSSSPPPMEDGVEDEDDEFSDFTGVPNSASFSEFDTPTTFNQSQALNATSPPELLSNGRIVGLSSQSTGSMKANGVAAGQTSMANGRAVSVEELKKLTSLEFPTGSRTEIDCNGTVEVLTNGFATSDQIASPPTPHKNSDDFADFSAFSNAEHDQPSNTHLEISNQGCRPVQNDLEEASRVPKITGSEGLSNGDWRSDLDQRDLETDTTEIVSTVQPLTLNGVARSESDDNSVSPDSNGERCSAGQSDEKGSETEETETETSFGRPLSTEALEEFGDFSTTGSVPSPPLQEETATPADHSQLAEDDDDEDFGDFGDFGDANAFSATSFGDFDQQGAAPHESAPDDFGDFDTSKELSKADEEAAASTDFPGSDSFADFSSAQVGDNGGWQAFSEPDQSQNEEESWAAFGQAHDGACTENTSDDWHESQPVTVTAPPTGVDERKSCTTAALVSRLEKIFQVSFELAVAPQVEGEVKTLNTFLKPSEPSGEQDGVQISGALRDVWQQLQDVTNAYGLRYQWGGSHTNKALLCSLGIDTRNILFTGHKKQPVIVPMYAASLGMLEPTKEPVKPVSAAEMIASIAQSPSVATELSSCPPDNTQESLPPIQFDWSSSGLTNPLDTSGGSSLLNLDFFGPVDESPSGTATSIPGVDPELYELTQVKLDVNGGSSRVVDAFARLMSTVEKTSTSTRKPMQKEENLSEEARQVIAGLPDLSFMQAKVLMFPSTLTPLLPSSSPSPTPD